MPPTNHPSGASSRKRKLILALAIAALAILGNVVTTLAAGATLLREPYVQQVYTNSLIVAWTTAESGPSEVRFGTSDFGTTASATSTHYSTGESAPYDSYYLHQATLTGLSANTVYQYKIYTNGTDITPGGSIDVRTAKSASSTSFRFAALGDSGTGTQNQIDVAERLLQVQPDLAVHTGDIIYNTSTYTHFEERYFQIYGEFIKSVWFAPSPGNHDTDYNSGQSYVDVFINPENGASDPIEREMYYSFDYANAHFSVVTPEVTFSSSSDQYQWLENDLANTNKFWKFVVFHEPPYYTDSSQNFRKKGASALVPLFQQQEVDIVLSGDVHLYERFKLLKDEQLATIEEGGILYVVTGGGGVGLNQSGTSPWNPLIGEKARLFHLTMFDVNDCKVELSAVEKTSSGDSFDSSDIFDSYTLDRCEAGPPVADFSADSTSGFTPLTVNFSDLSSNGPTSWSWDFGDGGSSTEQNPSHTYTIANTYEVSLTATNAFDSDTETKTGYITVTDPPAPTADFSASPTSGTTPLTVDFTDLSTDSPISWTWNFGDGGSSTDQNPSHTYTSAGNFDVSLTATNSIGSDVETKTGYITVTDPPAPTADFSASSTSGTAPLTVDFTDLSTDAPTSWAWNFGDGGSSTAQNPSHTYTTAGNFDVSLTATNAYGSDIEAKTEHIEVLAPTAYFKTTSFEVNEDGGPEVTVTVELTGPYGSSISVNYATSDGTAVAPGDYTPAIDSLVFAPNETSKTFGVTIVDDPDMEDPEQINLSLTGASASEPSSATITILDNDTPPVIRFNKAEYIVNESDLTAEVDVELSHAFHTAITVGYYTSDGTANAGLDYTSTGNTLTFTPGAPTSQTITIDLIDNTTDEENETFTVNLANPTVAPLGTPKTATVSITDDDPAPDISFTKAISTVNESDLESKLMVSLSASF